MALQSALYLPLIESLDENGGRLKPGAAYEALAEKLSIDESEAAAIKTCGDGQRYNVFHQQIRWTRQTAVLKGLISKETRGVWELTKAGRKFAELTKIKPGFIVILHNDDNGLSLCAHAEDAASLIAPGSLDLILTSPPYPVVKRAYGRYNVANWLKWMSELMGLWRQLIHPDGAIAINLMDVHSALSPNINPYVERFTLDAIDTHGLQLAGRMPWSSPTKLGHIEWVAKRKLRPRNTLEHVLLFSPSSNPPWDATRLPPRTRKPRTRAQIESDSRRTSSTVRPSGLDIRETAFQTEKPAIADNLIIAGGAPGADRFSKACRSAGLPIHPARFPTEVPRRVIQLTTDVGDTVYDPMAGSNTTGFVAQSLGRKWIASEPILEYATSAQFRFDAKFTPPPMPRGEPRPIQHDLFDRL